ncbi:hypothetical protein CKO15_13805 [Halorhodospira abdelmalekii]|uniref:helix-turn-helix transcriptional regulator n=1 Tax=Halorhodospira abdelmalekii TaxID=421629 RepID=UPI0019044D2B|nr:helix-turn-helix transcriptional regulator [Halorhodospira abdelmalekii]MBK1736289.1 hypothetical protein [Halorhodospira abdelmalekii]MBK1736312.1 hypothetical protein [Halorhodospira abdelmalekii]
MTQFELVIRRQARIRQLSMAELARRAGISRQHLYNVCRCDRGPRLYTFVQLAKALHVEPTALFATYVQSVEASRGGCRPESAGDL